MSHLNRSMVTDRELRNFGTFLRRTGLNRPEGAFNSMPPALRRITSRGIPTSAFGPGGAFDEEPGDPTGGGENLLRMLAKKLSVEDWAALQQHLVAGEVDAEDDIEGLPDNAINGGMRGRLNDAPAMDSAARRDFAERYPDAARIGSDPYPRDPRVGIPAAVSGDARESFNRMFPDAARIRNV